MTSTTSSATGAFRTTPSPKPLRRRAILINSSGPKTPDTSKAAWNGRRCWKPWNGSGKPTRRLAKLGGSSGNKDAAPNAVKNSAVVRFVITRGPASRDEEAVELDRDDCYASAATEDTEL